MNNTYRILHTDDITSASVHEFGRAPHSDYTSLDSPCEQVLVDFRYLKPTMAVSHYSIDLGLQLMRCGDVSELLVIDEKSLNFLGLISARDIIGGKPIRFAEENRKARIEINVYDLMEPASKLHNVSYKDLVGCKIGDIVKTLKNLNQKYLMVTAPPRRHQSILGYFSLSHISWELDTNFDAFSRARSFAELGYVLHRH